MVISINNDANAPINKLADYVIQGNLETIIPKMIWTGEPLTSIEAIAMRTGNRVSCRAWKPGVSTLIST